MARTVLIPLATLLLAACGSSWDPVDHDEDGISALAGDCWDAVEGPEGTNLTGADIFPGAAETFYDGIDQDCAGDDDFDADGDGYVPDEFYGAGTVGVAGSGELPGGDCWDDPAAPLPEHTVVGSDLTDKQGNQLDWAQPTAAEVNPAAADIWYDGVDQDCAGDDDFDKDGDGYRAEAYPDQDGAYGDDCIDGNDLDDENFAGDAASDVNPAAEEVWYDGTDQDCDDNDCDQDGDGYEGGDGLYCVPNECNDYDADIYPDPSIPEVWYNGEDENCDGNDGDQDGDGYWVDDYDDRVIAAGGAPLTIPTGRGGDCWDVPVDVATAPTQFQSINGFPDLDAVDCYPGATDAWYDAVDQDCAGDDDFDQDGDWVATETYPDRDGAWGTDCDDTDGAVFPGQSESWYDGTDQDCDGNDGDVDGDGYWSADYESLVTSGGGTPLPYPETCGDAGTLSCAGDCNDGNADVHPNRLEDCRTSQDDDCDGDTNFDAEEEPGVPGDAIQCTEYFLDTDRDSYGSTTSLCFCEPQDDYDTLDNTDCDDGAATTFPGADEYCDGHDDDCDGAIDEDSAVDALTWYQDADTDSYGNPAVTDIECYQPSGYVADNTDCDDTRSLTNPGATEYCDGVHDDDCDGTVDEADADGAPTWYHDADQDGFGDPADSQVACEIYQPSGYIADNTDCDDTDPGDYPGAPELIANNDDEDCDGGDTCYEDLDLDSYGTSNTVLSSDTDCSDAGESYSSNDCDDGAATTYPAATEYCDGHDDDCDGEIDEDESADVLTWYADSDSDTYGDPAVSDIDCYQPTGYVADNTDCDDSDALDYPGATEITGNEDDESCDGTEVCYLDADDDGYLASSPGTVVSTDTDCTDAYEGRASEPFTDCDDGDAGDYPGATEIVGNEDDEDCDGQEVCYDDDDNDGYLDTSGDTRSSADVDCTDANEGRASDPFTDCDDSDAGDYPGATEIIGNEDDESCDGTEICYDDDDNDGYLDTTADTRVSFDIDCDDAYEAVAGTPTTDCDDTNATAYPGATEYCDGHDDDCDGEIDEDASADVLTWYADSDSDTYGDPAVSDIDCYQPTGYVADNTDCDDSDAGDYPGATEITGNQDDEDCDGREICFHDDDNDGFLDASGDTVSSTDTDCTDAYEGTSSDPTTDCDDANADAYPGASEVTGNGVDEDCDGGEICYDDADDDGYLASSPATRVSADEDCSDAYEGLASDPMTDCDDADAGDYPGATEIVGNQDDEDCNGQEICYQDADDDGYLAASPATRVSTDTDCTDTYEGTSGDPTTDCDDLDAGDHPGATETVGNGDDEDCDGGEICYYDQDNDGYLAYSPTTRTSSDTDCSDAYEGLATDPMTDCDDTSASDYPGAPEDVANGDDEDCDGGDTCYADTDGDGYGGSGTVSSADLVCTDSGESANSSDCDDGDPAQYPGAAELCNDEDDDCDGLVDDDDGDTTGQPTWYLDYDGDSHGDAGTSQLACDQPTGYVSSDDDCLDTDPLTYTGATEIVGNEVDNDCNGGEICYKDLDGDGYGQTATKASSDADCQDSQEATNDDDCDDTGGSAAAIHPGATETCDDLDNDCDGLIDDADTGVTGQSTWWRDADTDGWGVSTTTTDACDQPSGYVASGGDVDCDDADIAQYPGADEYCNGEDDDCDGSVDEDDAVDATTWYGDLDDDGYGDPAETYAACEQPTYYVADNTDCEDTEPLVYPGADEICDDGLINDCDLPTGGTAGNTCPAVGALVITEIMPNPGLQADSAGEWVEVYNPGGSAVDLWGTVLRDDDGSDLYHFVDSLEVPAGGYAVLARSATAVRDYDVVYTGFTLGNSGSDNVTIATYGTDGTDGTVIDEVAYTDAWAFDTGVAMALDAAFLNASDNDSSANWAEATCAYDLDNSGSPVEYELGTPMGDNDLSCPVIDAVDPSERLVGHGGAVTVSGTDLAFDPADVVVTVGEWGIDDELVPSGTSSTEVDVTVPSESAQISLDLVLYNGINIAILEDALRWVSVEHAWLWWPVPYGYNDYGYDLSVTAGDTTETLYGMVTVSGAICGSAVTGLTAEVGYGPVGSDPRFDADSWTWFSAAANAGASSCPADSSEYLGTITTSAGDAAGDYPYTFRYSVDGGPWLYGLLRDDSVSWGEGGYQPGDFFVVNELGTLTIN
jgi:hypothetical protein